MSPIPTAYQLLAIALLCIGANGSLFDTGGGAVTKIDTVVYSSEMGTQYSWSDLPFNTTIVGEPVKVEMGEVCVSPVNLSGKIAIMEDSKLVRSIKRASRAAACAEAKGAEAVILITDSDRFPGWITLCSFIFGAEPVGIPVLEAGEPVRDLQKSAGPVSGWTAVHVVVNRSLWLEMFAGWGFILCFRVLLPIIAFFALFRCSACLLGHILRPPPSSLAPTYHWAATRTLVMAILAMEVFVSLNLLVYTASGPSNSTAAIPYEFQWYLLVAPVSLSIFSSLVGIALFVRWGTVAGTASTSLNRERVEKCCVAAGVFFILAGYGVTTLLMAEVVDFETSLMMSTGASFLGSMTSFVVFLYCGKRFMKRIVENKTSSTSKWAVQRRERSLRKFFRWIKMSSIANFLLISPALTILILPPRVTAHPYTSTVAFFVIYLGSLIQSIAQSYGLQPEVYLDEERRGESEAARQKYENQLAEQEAAGSLFLPEKQFIARLWAKPRHSPPTVEASAKLPMAIYPSPKATAGELNLSDVPDCPDMAQAGDCVV